MQIGWVGSIGHLRTLTIQKLVLELETRPRTEPFRIHIFVILATARYELKVGSSKNPSGSDVAFVPCKQGLNNSRHFAQF